MAQEPFGDIPLFREIQRLLSSSRGPVNFEIARQVALAVATQGTSEAPPDDGTKRALVDAVHASAAPLAGYTRLPLDEAVRAEVVTLGGWVRATLEGWLWILEHVARRLTEELTTLGGQTGAEDSPMQAALGQIGPLLAGMQAGGLIGQLGKDALGRYDFPIPRNDDRRLLFVAPNIERAASDYGLERTSLHSWLALHETARHLVLVSVPWADRYFRSLLVEVVDAIEIDTSDLERRFGELQSMGMEALQSGAPDNMLPTVPTERHRRALERLRTFLALLEGYAAHSAGAVAHALLPGVERIDEGMARRRAASSEGRALLESVLGVSVDRALETSGATFCAAVVELKGLNALNRVWEAPDNLPDTGEIRDPFAWMERHAL